MTSNKNVPVSSESKKQSAPDRNRRSLALSMLGLLGGSAFLKACAVPASDETRDNEQIGTAVQELVGTPVKWADTIFGSGGPNNRSFGDLFQTSGAIDAVLVIVKGAEFPGDGGGGIFYWDPDDGTDDGGTVIVPGGDTTGRIGGCWRRIYEGPLDAKWFGTSDMAQSIQRAVDAAATSPLTHGGRVYVPAGKHVIKRTIDMQSGVELYGAGAATILELYLPPCAPPNYEGACIKILGKTNVRIRNLTVDGKKSSHVAVDAEQQAGIVIAMNSSEPLQPRSTDIVIENCISMNCAGHGILVREADNVAVRGCSTLDNGRPDSTASGIVVTTGTVGCMLQSNTALRNVSGGIAVEGIGTEQTQVLNCHTDAMFVVSGTKVLGCLVNNTARAPGIAAILVGEASRVTVANCRIITNCNGIHAHPLGLIYIEGAYPAPKGNIFNGNTIVFDDNKGTLTGAGAAAISTFRQSDLSVTNNNIGGVFETGIMTERGTHQTICDNAIAAVDNSGKLQMVGRGILLSGTGGTVISGNAIRGYEYGVHESGSVSNIVTGNVLRDNQVAYDGPPVGSIVDHNIT